MPRFLDTLGYSDIAIAICDRCRLKRPHADLSKDPNFPGLMVCSLGCKDQFDPYRLPARKTERITIRFPRPDANIALDPNDIITTTGFVISTNQNTDDPEDNGNLDVISTT
jgi:hypothetical protein